MAKGKKPAKKKKPLKKKSGAKKASPKKTVKKTAKKKPAKKTAKKSVKKVAAKKTPAKKIATKKATVKKAAKNPTARLPRPKKGNGLPEQLYNAALKVLDDRQAEDIVSFDLEGRSSVADYILVASGRASRQLSAIAHYLKEAFQKLGVEHIRMEGVREGNWVLIDAGDVIIHLFRPEVRRYYNIESIWNREFQESA